MLGLGASDFEFGVDPSADPELALVRQAVALWKSAFSNFSGGWFAIP